VAFQIVALTLDANNSVIEPRVGPRSSRSPRRGMSTLGHQRTFHTL
jgi:hypothetical protein